LAQTTWSRSGRDRHNQALSPVHRREATGAATPPSPYADKLLQFSLRDIE